MEKILEDIDQVKLSKDEFETIYRKLQEKRRDILDEKLLKDSEKFEQTRTTIFNNIRENITHSIPLKHSNNTLASFIGDSLNYDLRRILLSYKRVKEVTKCDNHSDPLDDEFKWYQDEKIIYKFNLFGIHLCALHMKDIKYSWRDIKMIQCLLGQYIVWNSTKDKIFLYMVLNRLRQVHKGLNKDIMKIIINKVFKK